MNAIRQTHLLNKRELENATPPSASWHADYRDTAYIYVGGLNLDLTEGDVVTIFSQYGNPTHLNLIRDKDTGKSKGFAFLKYEDQRSCDLAVDNLGGAEVLGRMLRVDHTRYKKKDNEDEDTYRIDRLEQEAEAELNVNGKRGSDNTEGEDGEERHERKKRRSMLKEERELEELLAIEQGGEKEEEDPMRDYLIREKREEVERAKEREKHSRSKHRHRRREDDEGERDEERSERRHRHRDRVRHDRDRPKDDEHERRRKKHEDHHSYRHREHRHRGHQEHRQDRKSSRDRHSRREDD
ncbi:uncharacterized protein Z518_01129 [Rhinocladiella mackenziei CBS 650.93]|uniref:RRM domain-containing protein n=1 Tax=Rhinocladiella mackenziei CBS 650.93 TaxID=1442369 RepID=A0A0D2HHE3_9EURO|nr:uncharacterized protein Z518_01129 [Rhinocladiella mackenziei CBS 650.93]KIX10048.1 hypothetical protein Z518_01129 [Rhinocladiella mackenziei CBS 650.93]